MAAPDDVHDRGDIATLFFDAAAAAGITTIQFKSTLTLRDAFAGREDFDLLVPPRRMETTIRLAEELGFRIRHTDDPFHPEAVVDLLGWDPSTSRLHHLSFHRSLVFGERPIKRFVIPWDTVSALSTVEQRPGLHTLPAAEELALLLARIILRSSRPARLRSPRRRVGVPLDDRMREELRWLSRDVDDPALARATSVLLPGAGEVLVRVRRGLEHGHTPDPVATLPLENDRRTLVRVLRPLATRSATSARLAMLRHHRAHVTRHVGRGGVIALVGADGAGKSTVSEAIVQSLGGKITVRRVYLGLPRDTGPLGSLAIIVSGARRLGARRLARALESIRPVLVARIRRRAVREAHRSARRGVVSVTDRYPLWEFRSVEPPMDGPRLSGDGPMARLERRIYDSIPQDPDVLIALVGDPEVLIRRKPGDEDPSIVRQKAHAVRDLATSRTDVTAIDASQQLDTVVTRAITAVWEHLDGPAH